MTDKLRLCVFYTDGLESPQVLDALRKTYADYEVVFLVPEHCKDLELIRTVADEVVFTPFPSYPPHRPLRLLGLIQEIRRPRYDRFIVLFDSTKQRILTALSGCSTCECWAQTGRTSPMETRLSVVLRHMLFSRFQGWFRWLYIWMTVTFIPIRPRK